MENKSNKDITHLIPERFKGSVPRLSISPVAHDELIKIAGEMSLEDENELLAAVASSAASFATSDYFRRSAWFQRMPKHSFIACVLQHEDNQERPVLVLEPKTGLLQSESEVDLGQDYPELRVLEETRVEYFPPKPPSAK